MTPLFLGRLARSRGEALERNPYTIFGTADEWMNWRVGWALEDQERTEHEGAQQQRGRASHG